MWGVLTLCRRENEDTGFVFRNRNMEKVVVTNTQNKSRELLSQSEILDEVTGDDCIQGVS